MRAVQVVQRHLRVSSNCLNIRHCSSYKKKSNNSESKDIATIYTQKWEPKVLSMKKAMNTGIDITNVHNIEKCMDEIDEINQGLKRFCKSIANSRNSNIENMTQNINNLHQQIQNKTKSNQTLQIDIDNLKEELQANNQSLDEITKEKDGLNKKLNENEILIQELRETNNSIEKQLNDIKNELKLMEQELIEKTKSDNGNDMESNEDEINKTKSNMANLLRDLIDLENEYNKLKMICIGLGSVLLIGLIDVYRTRQKLKQTRLEFEGIEQKMNDMFYFKR